MSEPNPQRLHHIPVWGLFLLFLGTVFLLQTFHVLPWSLWGTLWRFWPVLIIIIGLGILLRQYNPWLVSGLILLLLLACLGIAIWQHGPSSQNVTSYTEPLDGLQSAQVELELNAAELEVGSLTPGAANLVEAASTSESGGGFLKVSLYREGSTGRLYLSTARSDGEPWDEPEGEVKLSRDIPLTMNVRSAVGNLYLDLGELEVTELTMDLDAGNYTIRMPAAGVTSARIKADVTNLEIIIPEGTALSLKADTDLSTLEIAEERFPGNGGYYVSSGFASAGNRIEVELESHIGRVQVR